MNKATKILLILLAASSFGIGTATAQTAPATATLHPSDVHQTMYGFGASLTYSADTLADFKNRDLVYKELYSDLGMDILRLRNFSGYDGQQAHFDKVTKEFAKGAIKYSAAKYRNGKGPVRLMFTAWSPPADLKSNASVNGRGNATLAKDAQGKYVYDAYANWWLASLQNFKADAGQYPDYIALQNELDFAAPYEGCSFLPTEGVNASGQSLAGYDQALEAVWTKLNSSLGVSAPKIVGPETFSISTHPGDVNHVQEFVDPATPAGQEDLSELFGISYHLYGAGEDTGKEDIDRFRANLATLPPLYHANGVDKPMFENEFLEGNTLAQTARIINDTITYGEASAYLVWIGARSEATRSSPSNYALIYFDPVTGLVERRDRFYAMKAFSAYVGEGWKRIGADISDPNIDISAFISPDSKQLVAVLVNPNDSSRIVQLSSDSKLDSDDISDIHRSSPGDSGDHWTMMGRLDSSGTVRMPAQSVATVHMVRQ